MKVKTKNKKRDRKVKQPEQSYPHVIMADEDGQLIAYSRASVSWVPTPVLFDNSNPSPPCS